ncbi:hypothetical protein GCM10022205_11220 [Spinactinospora alkalitolerans]
MAPTVVSLLAIPLLLWCGVLVFGLLMATAGCVAPDGGGDEGCTSALNAAAVVVGLCGLGSLFAAVASWFPRRREARWIAVGAALALPVIATFIGLSAGS